MKNTTNTSEPTEPSAKKAATLYVADLEIRDYFAAKAMVGMFADSDFATHDAGVVTLAKAAYKMADAMIAERNKPENNNV